MYLAKFNKNGNIKVGKMYTFNKLAGNGIIAGCKGTCGEHCVGCYDTNDPKKSKCYVFKSYTTYGWDKSTVVKSHINNTNMMRNNIKQTFADLDLQLTRAKNKPAAVRIHASGELETVEELMNWMDLAQKHSNIPFYIYTKNFTVVDICLTKRQSVPSNFFLNISIWHEIGIDCYNKWKHIDNVRAFVYDDGEYDYSKSIKFNCECPAYKTGKLSHEQTCDKCKICFRKILKVCSCKSH